MSRPIPTRTPPPPPPLALLDAPEASQAPEPARRRPHLLGWTDARVRDGLREAVLRFLDEEL